MANDLRRKPSEQWEAYINRLERERLKVIAEQQEQEAEALAEVGEERNNETLIIASNARRAAAEQFRSAIRKIDGGSS